MTETESRAKLVRRASGAVLSNDHAPDDPRVSWFGRVRLARPGETWPVHEGKPMMPLCQFNLAELPYRPDRLSDLALITVFITQSYELPNGTPNGDGWLVRAYPALDGLVVIDEPEDRGYLKPVSICWEAIDEDYPCWDDASSMDLPPEFDDTYSERFETQQGTKIGGWPFLAQSEIYWAPSNQHPANPEYVFQIDSEPNALWSWGDAGFGYFGRGTGDARDQWVMEWQCY